MQTAGSESKLKLTSIFNNEIRQFCIRRQLPRSMLLRLVLDDKGFLICGMSQTAKHIIMNMLDSANKYESVLNRIWVDYLTPSHPSFLTLMVKDYNERTTDLDLSKDRISRLVKEYIFFVKIGKSSSIILTSEYFNIADERSCSFIEDYRTANKSALKKRTSWASLYPIIFRNGQWMEFQHQNVRFFAFLYLGKARIVSEDSGNSAISICTASVQHKYCPYVSIS